MLPFQVVVVKADKNIRQLYGTGYATVEAAEVAASTAITNGHELVYVVGALVRCTRVLPPVTSERLSLGEV